MDEGLPDPDADRAAWERLARRQQLERRARWRLRPERPDVTARDSVVPEPTPGPGDPVGTSPDGLADPGLAAIPDDQVFGTFPNHEAASVLGRTVEGAVPVLALVVPVWAIMLILWIVSSSPIPLVLLVAETAVYVGIAVAGYRTVRVRTPSAIVIEPGRLTATWGGRPPLERTILFDRLTGAEDRSWRWTHGKGAYAMFVPPSVRFSLVPEPSGRRAGRQSAPLGVLYLTDQNLTRLRAAWQRWAVDTLAAPGAPLASQPVTFGPA